jgi:hypothetical protein
MSRAVGKTDGLLAAYVRAWAAQQALVLAFGGFASRWDQLQAALVFAAALSGHVVPTAFAFGIRVVDLLSYFPFAWESYYWCAQMDGALLLALLIEFGIASKREPAEPSGARADRALLECSATVRLQLVVFYASAAFWKINSSFLNSAYSCAPIFPAQLLAAYLPAGTLDDALVARMLASSPMLVIGGEAALAAALLLAAACGGGDAGGRLGAAGARVGVALALLLHFGIALTPPPNNVGAFSVIMAARLPAFCPRAFARACRLPRAAAEWALSGVAVALVAALTRQVAAVSAAGGEYAAMAAVAAAAAAAPSTPTAGGSAAAGGAVVGQLGIMFLNGVDWSVPLYALLGIALLGALARADGAAPAVGSRSRLHACARASLVVQAAAHGFALPAIGVQDIGGSNMYGNLRMQGGSNHLLAPTAALQLAAALPAARLDAATREPPPLPWRLGATALARMASAAFGPLATSPFAGGVARVEHLRSEITGSLSERLYPGEVSAVLAPSARALLRAAGHSGRQFNHAMGAVLGAHVLPARDAGAPFVRFTLPALQLRRLLADERAALARAARPDGGGGSAAFAVAYARLPGAGGDEAWRTSGALPLVVVAADREGESCALVAAEHAPAALALLARPDWAATWAAARTADATADAARFAQPCPADELALLPALSFAERLLGVWSPYPIVDGQTDELHCFGP